MRIRPLSSDTPPGSVVLASTVTSSEPPAPLSALTLVEGGTAVILHRFSRHFVHGTQDPYRALFHALREGRLDAELATAERATAADQRAVEAYRAGRAGHPLLPYADWSSCAGRSIGSASC